MTTEMLKTIFILSGVCFFLIMFIPTIFYCLNGYLKKEDDPILNLVGAFFSELLFTGIFLGISFIASGLCNC
jgi:ABC-type transport system involved in multi-copper enzyme maturation permease subunit